MNIAHRGGRKLWPEHTTLAYDGALQAGADVIEFDLHATSDGVIVALHDATVDRTTDGKGLVKDMTWAQLQKLDAGFRFSKDGGKSFPHRSKGLKVPRLDDLLVRYPAALIAVEIKQHSPSIVEAVAAQFEQAKALERSVFASFADPTIEAFRKRVPGARTALALGEMLALVALSDAEESAYSPPGRYVQAPFDQVTTPLMGRANRLGLRVQPWTVNKKSDMLAMLKLGVHGMFTDDPVLLASLVTPTQ